MLLLECLKELFFIILVGAGINTFSSYISSQDVVQRFTTTTDIKELRKMTFGNGFLSIGTTTVIYLIGTALFVFYHQNLITTAKTTKIIACKITPNRFIAVKYQCSFLVLCLNKTIAKSPNGAPPKSESMSKVFSGILR